MPTRNRGVIVLRTELLLLLLLLLLRHVVGMEGKALITSVFSALSGPP